jgi:hypothetical protein
MHRAYLYPFLIVAMIAAGCAPDSGGGDDDDDDDLSPPDAGMVDPPPDPTPDAGPPDQPDPTCDQPGTQCDSNADCCPDTAGCVNFEEFGAYCAARCNQDSDCVSGCCAPLEGGGGTCAFEEFCDIGGAYPERTCTQFLACGLWDGSQADCEAAVESCLGGLSGSQYQQWWNGISACWDANQFDCNGFYQCWLNVPYC